MAHLRLVFWRGTSERRIRSTLLRSSIFRARSHSWRTNSHTCAWTCNGSKPITSSYCVSNRIWSWRSPPTGGCWMERTCKNTESFLKAEIILCCFLLTHYSFLYPDNAEGSISDYIYIYAFSRRFYPKWLTVHSGYTFNFFMCVPWELNPQPFAQLMQCSTTEPQEHMIYAISCDMFPFCFSA